MTNQSHAAGSLDQVKFWRPCDGRDALCRAQGELRLEYRATFKLIAKCTVGLLLVPIMR